MYGFIDRFRAMISNVYHFYSKKKKRFTTINSSARVIVNQSCSVQRLTAPLPSQFNPLVSYSKWSIRIWHFISWFCIRPMSNEIFQLIRMNSKPLNMEFFSKYLHRKKLFAYKVTPIFSKCESSPGKCEIEKPYEALDRLNPFLDVNCLLAVIRSQCLLK